MEEELKIRKLKRVLGILMIIFAVLCVVVILTTIFVSYPRLMADTNELPEDSKAAVVGTYIFILLPLGMLGLFAVFLSFLFSSIMAKNYLKKRENVKKIKTPLLIVDIIVKAIAVFFCCIIAFTQIISIDVPIFISAIIMGIITVAEIIYVVLQNKTFKSIENKQLI